MTGTFNVVRLAVKVLNENEGDKDENRGVIINTSSIAAFDGQIGTNISTSEIIKTKYIHVYFMML